MNIIEDTECTVVDIQEKWGNWISEIVESLTVKDSGMSKLETFQDTLKRSVSVGKESLIVRVLDVIDNMDYYEQANQEDKKYLQDKLCYLYVTCKSEIPSKSAFLYFEEKLQTLGFLKKTV